MTKRQRLAELARIIEKLCDGDRAAKDDFVLRDRVTLEIIISAAKAFESKRRTKTYRKVVNQ